MTGLIDLHCHILPELDDGADSLRTALAMARMAVADGIDHVVCTPHMHPAFAHVTPSRIAAATSRFRQSLHREGIPLAIGFAAEVHLTATLLRDLRAGRVPLLGRSNLFLLELSHRIMPADPQGLVRAIFDTGHRPVVVHPERFRWIEQRYSVLAAMRDEGALIQITAGSLLGDFGNRARYWSERLIDEGLVDLLASDGHDTRLRRPLMRQAVEVVARRIGEEHAMALGHGNPAAILAGRWQRTQQGKGGEPPHLSPAFILALRDRFMRLEYR